MKKLLALLVLCAVTAGGCSTGRKEDQAASSHEGQVLRHVVLMKFKDHVTPQEIQSIEEAFRALSDTIPEIENFEWGTNVSVENLADGFTHCFFVTFKSEADRAVYLPHPEHKKFGALLAENDRLDKVLVVDYWTRH